MSSVYARLMVLTVVALLALTAPAPAAEQLCHGQHSKPVLPETWEQHELSFYKRARAGYGLRRDTAYIQQLIARRQWASGFRGFPATPAEDRYVTLRDRLDLGAAGRRYLARHADVTAGYSIEDGWPGRPFILVRFTRDVDEHLAALRRVARFPRDLRAKRVRFSEPDLQRIADRIYKDEPVLRRAGFREPFVELLSPAAGRIEISVTTRRDDFRAYFAARYGPAVRVSVRTRTRTVYECAATQRFSVSANGRTLTLHWSTDIFVEEDRVELAEFSDRVVVGAVQRRPWDPDSAREPVDNNISVKLAAPLGERLVNDAGSQRRMRQQGPGPGEPACPPDRPPSEFERATRENERWGLPADPASVQRRLDAGGQFPPDQARWLGEWAALKPTAAVHHYLLVHRDEYAGETYVGAFPAPRGVVYRFSGHAAEHEAALKRLVRRPDLMSTETVPYTLRQLRAIEDRLRHDGARNDRFFDGYGRAGFYLYDARAEEDAGVVELEVIGTRGDAPSYFAARYGPLVHVTVIGDRYECVGSYSGRYRPGSEPT
jgi:hypothetical protein